MQLSGQQGKRFLAIPPTKANSLEKLGPAPGLSAPRAILILSAHAGVLLKGIQDTIREDQMTRRLFASMVLFCVAAFHALPAWPAYTDVRNIAQVRYMANADYFFVVGLSRWGGDACNALYAQVRADQQGKEKLLAIILAAFTAGKRIQFYGECNSNPDYFDVNYVVVLE
jgi:hypothetical protein